MDYARAYDSILHSAILASMRRRNVPEVLALAYLREARRACMTFDHADWSTRPVCAGVGLRQGCSAAPMLFRWVLADCMADFRGRWIRQGHGACLDTVTVSHVAWADDTWVFDSTQEGLEAMLQDSTGKPEPRQVW